MGVNQQSIQIVVKFMSKHSVSFTNKLELQDDHGSMYYIYISGTTDNSLLTLIPFLMQEESLKYELENKKVI